MNQQNEIRISKIEQNALPHDLLIALRDYFITVEDVNQAFIAHNITSDTRESYIVGIDCIGAADEIVQKSCGISQNVMNDAVVKIVVMQDNDPVSLDLTHEGMNFYLKRSQFPYLKTCVGCILLLIILTALSDIIVGFFMPYLVSIIQK